MESTRARRIAHIDALHRLIHIFPRHKSPEPSSVAPFICAWTFLVQPLILEHNTTWHGLTNHSMIWRWFEDFIHVPNRIKILKNQEWFNNSSPPSPHHHDHDVIAIIITTIEITIVTTIRPTTHRQFQSPVMKRWKMRMDDIYSYRSKGHSLFYGDAIFQRPASLLQWLQAYGLMLKRQQCCGHLASNQLLNLYGAFSGIYSEALPFYPRCKRTRESVHENHQHHKRRSLMHGALEFC